MSHFVFTGGGTAGHVVPALPVMAVLRRNGHRVTFIGSNSGYEARLVSAAADRFIGVPAGKLRRYWSWQNLRDVLFVLAGIVASLWHLGRLRPQAVFSKGGFVSLPVVLAAWCWRVPVIVHESDTSPGLANRLAYPFTRTLCVNFPIAAEQLGFRGPVVHVGTPLRDALLHGDAVRGRTRLDLSAERPLVLVTGGSLGADRLNEVVLTAAPELTQRVFLVHICGPGKCPPVTEWPVGYEAFEFLTEDWGDVLAAADLVVSRAGANTLFELLALRKPHILVPLSAAVSRGDQIENARYSEAQGYSRLLDDDSLNSGVLIETIDGELATLDDRRRAMQAFTVPPATELIVELLLEAAGEAVAGPGTRPKQTKDKP
ncbi:MAG: UDP-N-acetylglucosamine--N-acetylmuramyl-(pentapeptide) pyrophosphoryl-undecaprenol N-acetylglucosamine transferase [Pseudomonadota bacterium]